MVQPRQLQTQPRAIGIPKECFFELLHCCNRISFRNQLNRLPSILLGTQASVTQVFLFSVAETLSEHKGLVYFALSDQDSSKSPHHINGFWVSGEDVSVSTLGVGQSAFVYEQIRQCGWWSGVLGVKLGCTLIEAPRSCDVTGCCSTVTVVKRLPEASAGLSFFPLAVPTDSQRFREEFVCFGKPLLLQSYHTETTKRVGILWPS